MKNRLLSTLIAAFMIVSLFVSCSQESTIENLYLGDTATISYSLGAEDAPAGQKPSGTLPKKILSNKGEIIILPGLPDGNFAGTFKFAGWTDGKKNYEANENYEVEGSATLTARWKTTVSFTTDTSVPSGYELTPTSLTVFYGEAFNKLPILPTSTREFEKYAWLNANGRVITNETIVNLNTTAGPFVTKCVPYYLIRYYKGTTSPTEIEDAPKSYVVSESNLPVLYKSERIDDNHGHITYVIDEWKIQNNTTSPITYKSVQEGLPYVSYTDAIDRENHELRLYGDERKIIALYFNYMEHGSNNSGTKYVDITSPRNYVDAVDTDGNLIITTPTNVTGCDLNYWYLIRDDFEVRITSTTDIKDSDSAVYAKWKNNYTIVFTATDDGVSGSMSDTNFEYDTTTTLTDNAFTRNGFVFTGWRDAAGKNHYGNGSLACNTVQSAENRVITLYAEWLEISPTDQPKVTSETNLTTDTSPTDASPNNGQHLVRAFITGEGNPIYTTSTGWDSDYVGNDGKWTTAATGKAVYYEWAYNTYKVKFNINYAGATKTYSQNFTYNSPTNLTSLTDIGFKRTGYTFNHWSTSSTDTGTGVTTYTDGQSVTNLTGTDLATVNLYAQWQANKTTVKFRVTSTDITSTDYTYDSTETDLPLSVLSKKISDTGTTPTDIYAYCDSVNGYPVVVRTSTASDFQWLSPTDYCDSTGKWVYTGDSLELVAGGEVSICLVTSDTSGNVTIIEKAPFKVKVGTPIAEALAGKCSAKGGYELVAKYLYSESALTHIPYHSEDSYYVQLSARSSN